MNDVSKKYKNNENTEEYKIIKNPDLLLNYIKNGNEGIIENDRYTNHACILKKYQNNSMSDNYNIINLGKYKNTISLYNEINDNNALIDKESIRIKNYIKSNKNIEDDVDSEIYYKNAGAFKKYKKNDDTHSIFKFKNEKIYLYFKIIKTIKC
jgi:hypothetical protein